MHCYSCTVYNKSSVIAKEITANLKDAIEGEVIPIKMSNVSLEYKITNREREELELRLEEAQKRRALNEEKWHKETRNRRELDEEKLQEEAHKRREQEGWGWKKSARSRREREEREWREQARRSKAQDQ